MLINFNHIIQKYGKPKGIIHIGAHLLEERNDYISNGLCNTIWVEANPKIFSNIEFVNYENSDERVYNYAISDVDDNVVKFNVTNNGQSSSILELDKHKLHHPHIHVIETIMVKTKRMDTIIYENCIDMSKFNFLNLDIQGAELMALKGFGNFINDMEYIYTEVNVDYLYERCAIVGELDTYLDGFGFKRVETAMTPYGWGDALYIKSISV